MEETIGPSSSSAIRRSPLQTSPEPSSVAHSAKARSKAPAAAPAASSSSTSRPKGGTEKPKQTKSRTGPPPSDLPLYSSKVRTARYGSLTAIHAGCITCKNKRLKCDEAKPTCNQCKKRGVDCEGYKKSFQWKPFEEQAIGQRAMGKSTKRAWRGFSCWSACLIH